MPDFLARAALLGLGLALATPAQAIECWDGEDIAAARLKEFQIGVMVTQLRCKSTGFDFGEKYRVMLEKNRATLVSATEHLVSHMEGTPEDKAARHYDTYQTDAGNRYSNDRLTFETCKLFGEVSAHLGRPDSTPDDLLSYAWALVPDPLVEGERCPAAPITLTE